MIGKTLNNRYEVIEKIGEGGMAIVYKARCKVLNRFVAIKVLKDEFIDDEIFSKKFKRESQAAASLSHPNIVNVYDVGNTETDKGNIPYIVMEYIDGKTLKDIIREKGKLNSNETVFYSLQIADAIEHAHSNNIIHRDIKPHNIMINENDRVKVTDFGIARAITSSTVTIGADTLGSVHYISPEQARGGYTDEKSDIYSLGIVMYEMITGELPFDSDTAVAVALKHIQEKILPPSDIQADIPSSLESIILKCTSKNQSDRYQNMSELINDLKGIDSTMGTIVNEDKAIEDSPTMIIPPIGSEDLEEVEADDEGEDSDDKDTKDDKASGVKTTLLAILLALLVVGAMFFAYFRLKEGFKSSEVIVPDFIGMDIEEAELEAEKLNLKLVINDRVESDEFEEGKVIKQDQDADSKVKSGFTIGVIISEGGELIKIPNFVNQTLDEAVKLAEDLGLIIGDNKYETSDIVPKDTIIEQSPKAYTFVSKGDKIIFTISKGEDIKSVVMPRLVGKNIVDAKNELLAIGLKIGNVKEEFNNEFPKGVVYFQSSKEGEEVKINTKVDLYTSKGSKPEPEPEPEPKPEIKPEPKPETESLEGDIRFIITLPNISEDDDSYEDVEVTIKRTQDGQEQEVYNKSHLADASKIEVVSKGKKGSVFSIYFDGQLQETKTKQE